MIETHGQSISVKHEYPGWGFKMYKEIKGPRYFMRKAQNTMKQVIIKFYNSI